MTLSHRIHLQQILLVAVVAGAASHLAAAPQDTVTRYGAATTAPARRVTPTNTAQQQSAKLFDALLADTGGGPLTEPVLVIPDKPTDPQAISQAVEDLSIMGRIIEKNALGEYHAADRLLGQVTFLYTSPMSPPTEAGPAALSSAVGRAKPMYLGGYGAVFFIRVDFPLLPPPQAPADQPPAEQGDPVWAEAKRSVQEPHARLMGPQDDAEPAEPYSREQVDTLRTTLIATLKHATNIRALAPTEWITIVTQGPAPALQAPQGQPSAPPGPAPARGSTVLTLRATKGDVDQYAKGRLDQQQFSQRVQIFAY